jgi:hypothetical protein
MEPLVLEVRNNMMLQYNISKKQFILEDPKGRDHMYIGIDYKIILKCT